MRFKSYERPINLIDAYLYQVYLVAKSRGYLFDLSKIRTIGLYGVSKVTRGQLVFEFSHLLRKLEKRYRKWLKELKGLDPEGVEADLVFQVVEGEVEGWEEALREKRRSD